MLWACENSTPFQGRWCFCTCIIWPRRWKLSNENTFCGAGGTAVLEDGRARGCCGGAAAFARGERTSGRHSAAAVSRESVEQNDPCEPERAARRDDALSGDLRSGHVRRRAVLFRG